MSNHIYIGVIPGKQTVFRSPITPTFASHGTQFNCVIGPFRTIRGANFMVSFGQGNPHCRCVADAERLAQKYA